MLSPLIFILFVNDVFQLNSTNIELYLYADDTAIIFHSDDATSLQCIINDFCAKYAAWYMLNCIVINANKSNFLSFNVTDIVVNLSGRTLENLYVGKYLGILIDNKLTRSKQVNVVKNVVSKLVCLKKYCLILQVI